MAKIFSDRSGHKTRLTNHGAPRGLKVLFFILVAVVLGLTVWSISYNWRHVKVRSEANVFNLIKENLSNINIPSPAN
ncbi:MAG: hypothetical protein WC621_02565 [Patescibacteria group bacterium]